MRKFLKVCHIISRVFVFLCVAAAIVLLFLRPDGLPFGMSAKVAGGAFWRVFATTLALSAVMFSASDWAYRTLEENEFLEVLSSSILKPALAKHDLSDKRFQKTSADELDFNAGLRNISDGKERVLQELAWEKKNNKRLQKKLVGNGIVSLVFFLLALVFLIYPIVPYLMTGMVLGLPGGEALAFLAVAAVVLTFIIIFDYTGYQKALRRLNTVLSIRERSDEVYELERKDLIRPVFPTANLPEERPAAIPVSAAAPAQKKPEEASAPEILPEEVPAAAPADPVLADESVRKEQDAFIPAEPKESVFESLAPEESPAEN